MSYTFKCPGCGQTLSAKPEQAGHLLKCPSCNTQIQVPSGNNQSESHPTQMSQVATGSPTTAYPQAQGFHGMYAPMNYGGEKSAWQRFLSFDIMIADEFLSKIWLIASSLVALVAVFGFFVVLLDELGVEFNGVNFRSTGKAFDTFWRIFQPLVTGALTLLMLRIACEFLVLFFKIHTTIKEIRDGEKPSAH